MIADNIESWMTKPMAVMHLLRPYFRGRILDLGSGTGRNTVWFPDAVLVDRLEPVNLGSRKFIKSRIQEFKLNGYKYDTVLCSHVLEHIPNISQTVSWVRDHVITDDGTLVVALPNVDAVNHEGWRYDGDELLPHRHFFTHKTARAFMEAHGFDVVDMKTNFPGYDKPGWFIKLFGQVFNRTPWLRSHWADVWLVCKKRGEKDVE